MNKLKSFRDIENEKEKLKLLTALAEEKINNDIRHLSEKFSFSSIRLDFKESLFSRFYNVFRFGYNLFSRRKTSKE